MNSSDYVIPTVAAGVTAYLTGAAGSKVPTYMLWEHGA